MATAANDPAPEEQGGDKQAVPTTDLAANTLDDPLTDRAVEEIVREESDVLLTTVDSDAEVTQGAREKIASQSPPDLPRRGFWRGLGHGLGRWWHNRLARWLTILVVLGGLGTLSAMPTSRYWALNTAGVRVRAGLQVVDKSTGQPLKGVRVSIGPMTAKTDAQGKVTLRPLRLGAQTLTISQPGFASVHKPLVLGFGSNPLGEYDLQAVGFQYTLDVRDYITGQAIAGAEVGSDAATALSDAKGKAVVTLTGAETGDIAFTVTRQGYREQTITVKALTKAVTPVRLVTARRLVLVVKQNGIYNVITADADGQNQKLLLAGTGSENANIALAVSPDGSRAALVSSRDNQRDADGFLLSTLTLINTANGSFVTLAHAEQIQLIDWVGSRLVFAQVSAEGKLSASSRSTIISYDYATTTRLQLAASTGFSTVFGAQGSIVYGVAASDSDASVHPALYLIGVDGSGKKTIVDQEVWTAYRTDYNLLSLQTADGWSAYNLTNGQLTTVAGPSAYASRGYADNGANHQSLWLDSLGGQRVLRYYDRSSGKDVQVATQNGMTYPLYWLTDTAAVYRVVSAGETADYVVSTLGGQPAHKVSDVTNTYGFSWGQ